MTAFEAFISGPEVAVVNITTEQEFDKFLELCEQRGINKSNVNSLRRTGFSFCQSRAAEGELCIEYIINKGFTFDSKKAYKNYCDYAEDSIISFDDFVKNTDMPF